MAEIRQNFHNNLRRLKDDVLVLGSMVEGGIKDAVAILKQRDMDGSRRLIAWDERVNEKRFSIENEALTLIATQQPAAGDLRVIAAILEIITELERIGDYAKGIAKINLLIGEDAMLEPLEEFTPMTEKACSMLHRALDAFVDGNETLARSIADEDVQVDDFYNKIFRDVLKLIVADPLITDQATYLLWAAHNLERTGDRVVNICERIGFMVTGQMSEFDTHSSTKVDMETVLSDLAEAS